MMSGRKFSNLRAFNLWLFAPVPLESRFPVANETVDQQQQGKNVFVILAFIFHTIQPTQMRRGFTCHIEVVTMGNEQRKDDEH